MSRTSTAWPRKEKLADAVKAGRRPTLAPAAGAAAGATLMYVLDPDRGRRRRAQLRDKAVHATHASSDAASVITRDARNRGQGVVVQTRKRLRPDHPDDEELAQRVRTGTWPSPVTPKRSKTTSSSSAFGDGDQLASC